jgi:hypothetical protein
MSWYLMPLATPLSLAQLCGNNVDVLFRNEAPATNNWALLIGNNATIE